MNIENLEKLAFQGLYAGQRVLTIRGLSGIRELYPGAQSLYGYLNLRHLTYLTEEEIVEIIEMLFPMRTESNVARAEQVGRIIILIKEADKKYHATIEPNGYLHIHGDVVERDFMAAQQKLLDYLRAKSIATAWKNYTVRDLINLKWIKIANLDS